MSPKRKVSFSLITNSFFAFTLIMFGPYEIFISNSSDFNFTFHDFWWMLAFVAIIYVTIATFLFTLLPQKLNEICNIVIFSFTFCCYIQAMFLNKQMQVLVGKEISWNIQTITINLLVWAGIFIVFFLLKRFAKDYWAKIIQFFSSALIVMQLAALIFLLITTNVLTEEKNGYISAKGMLDLSANENVIVFILDYFDGRTMDSILSKNLDFFQPLDGFTYFPNATSVHSRTYPAITYLLTGNMCYFDVEPLKYVNDSYESSNFLPLLRENQVEVGLYTYNDYIGANAKSEICNYVPARLSLKFFEIVKYSIKMVLYRDMPYLIKDRFSYEAHDINNNVTSNDRMREAADIVYEESLLPEYKNFDDEWFYEMLASQKLGLTEVNSAFRFYHLGSCHLNLTNPEPYGIRSFEIIYDYLEQMRSLGIYDNATIIITTDHGSSGGGNTLDLPQQTAVPLLLVKPAGDFNKEVKISLAPVSHTDFIPTILDGFSLDYSDYGQTVFDIQESDLRDRYYYYSALYSDKDGEVELREYKVSGDARYTENYQFTGNTWNIIYSANIVSDRG